MRITRDKKNAVVSEIASVAANASAAVAADYSGITANEMNGLRALAREQGVYVRVISNRLARIAFADTSFACMHEQLTGPIFIAFSSDEPNQAAKVLTDFSKNTSRKIAIRMVVLDGAMLGGDTGLKQLATMPSLNEARSKLLGCLRASLQELVSLLSEPHARLVRLLAAKKN